MRFFLVFFTTFLSLPLWAQRVDIIDLQVHDFTLEYGLSYHTLRGIQQSNGSRARLTTSQLPYFVASYTYRINQNSGLRFFGGTQTVKFNEPKNGTLKNEDQILNTYGIEYLKRVDPIIRYGVFLIQQDHPIYFAKTFDDFPVLKKTFAQAGLNYSIGQRRRIGILWGASLKGYLMFPTKGGDVTTEYGYGAEANARVGIVGPLGTLVQLKGFYQTSITPNTEVSFNHEMLGYCIQVSYTF